MDQPQSADQEPKQAPADLGPDLEPPLPQLPPDPEMDPVRLSPMATTFWSMAVAAAGALLLMATAASRDQLVAQPELYLGRLLGRDLDAAEALTRTTGWQQALRFFDSSTVSEELNEAIDTVRRYQSEGLLSDPQSVWSLCVLLGESGRIEEAKTELDHLANNDENARFKSAFRAAYLEEPLKRELRQNTREIVNRLWPEWVRDKLQLRLAAKQHNALKQKEVENRIEARGVAINRRANVLSLVSLLLVGGGLGSLASMLWRGAEVRLANGAPIGLWSVANGYAVLVRGAGIGIILAGLLAYLSDWSALLTGFATLVSGAPMFWLTGRHLLRPRGETFSSAFGLRVAPSQFVRLGLLSLALMGLMILGESALSMLTSKLAEPSLLESIPEEFLFDSWPKVLASSIDAVIWAPIVEEVVFRGILYATLRRRMGWLAAALGSSAIFGVVHGYSLQGFLVICWSALLWAIAYEKSRSLWPGIICHALSNVLAVASPLVIYR